jgi:MATE family multidrug resistance protein
MVDAVALPLHTPTAKRLLGLAGPVIVTEIAGVSTTAINLFMVSHLGPEAIGAVGIGNLLFMGLGAFGLGFLYCLDPLVAQAFGRRKLDECHRWFVHGLLAAVVLAAVLWVSLRLLMALLTLWGLNPGIQSLVVPYVELVSWSYLPLLLFGALRRYLQAMGVVKPAAVATVSAAGVTLLASWVLVFGELGAPRLGAEGVAWAAIISRTYSCAFMAVVVVLHARWAETGLFRTSLRLDGARLREMTRLGVPAGAQSAADIGVFTVAAALAGRLDPASSAAHQIVFNVVALSFVVTLGVAGATAVLVGQAVGRADPTAARRSGSTALVLAAGFMTITATSFVVAPDRIIGLFTADATVAAVAVPVLMVAATFQLFDGIQVVATGALRGLGETRIPMITTLATQWLLGLPLGYVLCFPLGLGLVGLWIGLSIGLAAMGLTLLGAWVRRARTLEQRLVAEMV